MLEKFALLALLVNMTQAITDVYRWSKQVQNYLQTGAFEGFVAVLEKDFRLSDDPEEYHKDWRVQLIL